MQGLKAICLTLAEGRALAAALDAEGVPERYAPTVPDHDLVKDILKNGGALHVLPPERGKATRS